MSSVQALGASREPAGVQRLRERVLGQIDLAVCDGCGACSLRCTAGIRMSRTEYLAVREYESQPGRAGAVRAVREQDKAIDLGEGVTVTACRYRDMAGGGCAVYPARPLICRLLGHVEWLPCPIGRVRRTAATEDAVALMRACARDDRRTFEDWDGSVEGDVDAKASSV